MQGTILRALTKFKDEKPESKDRIKEALNTVMPVKATTLPIAHEPDSPACHNDDPYIEEAIEKFRKTMGQDESTARLRKGVKAFYQKRRYAEALENLKLLIQNNAADEFCVTAIMGCFLHLHAKDELAVAVELFLTETFEDGEKAALFKMMLADKMAQKGYAAHAEILSQHQGL